MTEQIAYYKLHAYVTPIDEICKCSKDKPIKLMQALGPNPLHCVDCNLEIAPESLALNNNLIDDIVRWQGVASAMELLELDSGEYESWAQKQLIDITSPVNQRGMELCKELNTICKCYLWYFQNETADDFEPITHCPNCNQTLMVYTNGKFKQLICEPCKLITIGEKLYK